MADSTNRNVCKVFGQWKVLQAVSDLMERLLWPDDIVPVSQHEVQTTDSFIFLPLSHHYICISSAPVKSVLMQMLVLTNIMDLAMYRAKS